MNQTERERAKISPVQVYCNPGFILWDIDQIKTPYLCTCKSAHKQINTSGRLSHWVSRNVSQIPVVTHGVMRH